jgi:CBS domain-containing protein
MAKQPGERPLAAEDLSRVSNVHSALEAVKAEIAARHTREGVSFLSHPDIRRMMSPGSAALRFNASCISDGVREGSSEFGRTAMKVADVMTRGVISIAPTDSMSKAAHLMLQYEMSGFPVMDRGRLVGILTEGDLLRRAEIGTECRHHRRWIELLLAPGRLAEEYAHAHGRKVEEVMTRNVVSVDEDAPLEEVVQLMERHHIKRLPVVRSGAMVGIVSRADLVHAFIVGSSKTAAAALSDRSICERLMATLDTEP